MSERDLIKRWQEIAVAQRNLVRKSDPPEIRAMLIATSNAWMMAADDLKKLQEKSPCQA